MQILFERGTQLQLVLDFPPAAGVPIGAVLRVHDVVPTAFRRVGDLAQLGAAVWA